MCFTVEIQCDNAAFDDALATETARILRNLAQDVEEGAGLAQILLRDANGSSVGWARFR